MFSSTTERLKWFMTTYLPERKAFQVGERPRLLDIGRYDSDAARHELLNGGNIDYNALPIANSEQGENMPENPYQWRDFADGNFDVVVSTHALEHVKFPWLVMLEIGRVLKPGGIACIIEPGISERVECAPDGKILSFNKHRFLRDYYRFSDDGLAALAESAALTPVYFGMNEWPRGKDAYWGTMSQAFLIAEKAPGQSTSGREFDFTCEGSIASTPWFSRKKSDKMKITCIGTCQQVNAYFYLRLAALNADVKLVTYSPPNGTATSEGKKDAVAAMSFSGLDPRYYEDDDILIVADFPELRRLHCKGGKVIVIPFITFRAFHPDFTAPGLAGSRTLSSNIVLECHRRGYSESKTLTFFAHDAYKRLGYYSVWDKDRETLRSQFSALDLDADYFLTRWMAKGVFMNDPAHPADFVTKDIVDLQCLRHGVAIHSDIYSGYGYFDYNFKYRLPVYPEIAEYLNIPETGSYRFRRTFPMFPPWTHEDAVDLEEYIHLSFREYAENPEPFEQHPRLKAL